MDLGVDVLERSATMIRAELSHYFKHETSSFSRRIIGGITAVC